MTIRQLGDFTVARIGENLRPGFEPQYLFPDWDPEILKEHGHWMMPNYYAEKTNQFIASIHSWLIRSKHHVILVDTCCGNGKHRPEFPRFHNLDTPYLERLRAAGVEPEDVDYVLCTHLHVDHVGWNTRLVDGRWVPTFPNAKYIFSRAERDHWDPTLNLDLPEDSKAIFEDSIHPVIAARQDRVVEAAHQIEEGLLIEPAPGHTPGHVMLRLLSGSEEAVFSGDILHHPIQVYRPQWNSRFCTDPVQSERTRKRVLEHCAEHNCRLLPAHFGSPHLGWVRRKGSGFSFDFDHGR